MIKNKGKNSFDYDLYKRISVASQEKLLDILNNTLVNLYSEERVIGMPQFVYAIGDIPVMLVAHLDTVHLYKPYEMFYDREQSIIWSPLGLGADDRAGVYSILHLLLQGYRPHVLFTTDEETGGQGAEYASKVLTPEVNFLVELDRQGRNDSVYYSCKNEKFEEYINSYGFNTEYGTFSDICILCSEWKIMGVNLSIGYVNEHTKAEYLNVSHMFSTIMKVKKLLEEVDPNRTFKYDEDIYAGFGQYYESFFKRYSAKTDVYKNYKWDKSNEMCYGCFRSFPIATMIEVGEESYCGECFAKYFSTCSKCKKVFKDVDKAHILCDECRKEV